jgi:hypothetical protein
MSDTLVNLPGGARARRAEEQRRLASIEAKLDSHLKGAAKAAPNAPTPLPPKSPVEAALERLAQNLGDDTWSLPACCTINRTMGEEQMLATGFTVDGVFFPLKLAYEIGIMALDGRIDYYRLGPLIHELKGRDPRAQPARRPRL